MAFRPFTISGYRIVERLAEGGSAEVYLAHRRGGLGWFKKFAVKKISGGRPFDPGSMELIKREVSIHRSLIHKNIVQMKEAFLCQGDVYIVMDMICGGTLRSITRHLSASFERLPLPVAVLVVKEICLGLAHAHSAQNPRTGAPFNIIHRDVSPNNIMISRAGEVRLIDFGIARKRDSVTLTKTGLIRGTVSYMSPEQAGGRALDRRTDIYSAGLILLELVSGIRVHEGVSGPELLRRIRDHRLPEASALNPKVSGQLNLIIRRATMRSPAHRFPNMEEFVKELESCLGGQEKKARGDLKKILKRALPKNSLWAQFKKREPELISQEDKMVAVGIVQLEQLLGISSVWKSTDKPQATLTTRSAAWRSLVHGGAITAAILLSLTAGALSAHLTKTHGVMVKKGKLKVAHRTPSSRSFRHRK